MGAKVGIPILKLSANGGRSKRKGNALAVAKEAFEERASADPDLNRNLSKLNVYEGYLRGTDLYAYWMQEAASHRDPKGRKLRSDAVIGFSAICKPDKAFMDGLQEAQQLKFLEDSKSVLTDLFAEHGLEVDAVALHRDEVNPHLHIFGHDPAFQAGKKIGLPLFSAFNRTYPERMRQLGWQVDDLMAYDDAAVKAMTEEEAAAYKDQHIRTKKQKGHGKSSLAYKSEKVAEQQAQLEAEQERLDEIAAVQQATREALEADRAALERERQEFTLEKKNWQEKANKASQAVKEQQAELSQRLQSCKAEQEAYEKAKTAYELAYDRAAGVAKGFSLDTVEAYGEALKGAIKSRCEQVRYTNGKTLWDIASRPLQAAVSESIRLEMQNAAPVILAEQEKRTKAADRRMPHVPETTRTSGYEPEF